MHSSVTDYNSGYTAHKLEIIHVTLGGDLYSQKDFQNMFINFHLSFQSKQCCKTCVWKIQVEYLVLQSKNTLPEAYLSSLSLGRAFPHFKVTISNLTEPFSTFSNSIIHSKSFFLYVLSCCETQMKAALNSAASETVLVDVILRRKRSHR